MLITKGLAVAAVAALVLASPAKAGDQATGRPAPPQQGATVGIGVICDTSEQASHFVSLRAAGEDVTPAVKNVNARAQQPRACGVAAIAFMPGETMDTKAINGRLVRIVRVTVVAGYDGFGWQRVANAVQYAIVEAEGYSI
jgi:hypothetical protein